MNKATLTELQEVYFDLCDLLDNNDLADIPINGFFEHDNLLDFITEQRNKLARIELSIDLERV